MTDALRPTSDPVAARCAQAQDLVVPMARSAHRRIAGAVDEDELCAAAREGLFHAARSFDPARGLPFRAWAAVRMRFALLERVRRAGPLPKRVYRTVRMLQAADAVADVLIEEDSVRRHDPDEADRRIGAQLGTMAVAMGMALVAPLPLTSAHTLADDGASPEEQVARAQLLTRLRVALASLPESERVIVERHYFDDVTLDDASKELGLSKSWGSRLHARAIGRLASLFGERHERRAEGLR